MNVINNGNLKKFGMGLVPILADEEEINGNILDDL